MTQTLDELKTALYEAFDGAAARLESLSPSHETQEKARENMAKIAQVILNIEKDQREVQEARDSLKLAGK